MGIIIMLASNSYKLAIPEIPATETFVKLCTVIMDAPSAAQTTLASVSGLPRPTLGTDSSRLN